MIATYEGIAAPGLRVLLNGLGSRGADLRYLWIQTDGPSVELERVTTASASFIMPPGSSSLRFILVAVNSAGMDFSKVTVIPEGASAASRSGEPPDEPFPRADAGDDQIGVVGRQITLNGIRSEPRGKIGYRWIQVSGVPVRLRIPDGYIFSFVPESPGVYQFALVVARGGEISEPDLVEVTVRAGETGIRTAGDRGLTSAGHLQLSAVARSCLASIEGGSALAPELAKVFDTIAERSTLYGTYAELYGEMSRRLDLLIPADEPRRKLWIDRFFVPLTSRLITEMNLRGVELLSRAGQLTALTPAQQEKLGELFREIAEGIRPPAADGGR